MCLKICKNEISNIDRNDISSLYCAHRKKYFTALQITFSDKYTFTQTYSFFIILIFCSDKLVHQQIINIP